MTLYQAICFPVYRVEKVRRADYISIDRRHLAYLNDKDVNRYRTVVERLGLRDYFRN